MVPIKTKLLHPSSSGSIVVVLSFFQTFFGVFVWRVFGGRKLKENGEEKTRDFENIFGAFMVTGDHHRGIASM